MSDLVIHTNLTEAALEKEAGRSLWADAGRRLLKNKMAVAGGIFLLLEILLAIAAPYITPYSFEEQNLELWYAAPSWQHWLGTDSLGRDQLTRLLFGLRISLLVGFLASFVAVIFGVLYGAISGYFGGRIDTFLMRTVDVLFAVPFVFVVIILMVYFGRELYLLFLAIGMTQWLTMARIVRGQVISLKEKEFVSAAVSLGVRQRTIIFKHLIPNAMGPVIVYTTLTIPEAMIGEAFLSFLGLGVQAPMASLGTLIQAGSEAMEDSPIVLLAPALTFGLTLMSLNFLGDGLRDALDPKGAKD